MKEFSGDPVNEFIRLRIRAIRRQKSLSVRQAARLSRIPESSYSCMENGFYRITLQNLKKILDALEIGIEQVWPCEENSTGSETLCGFPNFDTLARLRLFEILNLTGARQAAVVRRDGKGMRLIHAIHLTEGNQIELLESLETGLMRGWRIEGRESGSISVWLCLRGGNTPAYLKSLIETYLKSWLAAEISD